MTASDRNRLNLYQKLDELLGSEEANTLMEHLPPVPWNEVATKNDVTAMGVELRAEMTAMGKELRAEMTAMRSELRSEMATMGSALRSEIQVLGAELRAEMTNGFNRQIKWLVTFGMAWSSLLVAATRFTG